MNRDDIIKMAREAGFYVRKCEGSDEVMDGDNWHTQTELVEEFARLVAAAEREKSLRLWMLLDDIDTADDIAKSDDKLYRSICQRHQKKRWEILSGEEVDAAIRAKEKNT